MKTILATTCIALFIFIGNAATAQNTIVKKKRNAVSINFQYSDVHFLKENTLKYYDMQSFASQV